jgi:ethanolamine-phosphate cytidylyltransferase
MQFAEGRPPMPGDKIVNQKNILKYTQFKNIFKVYACGSFDLFHIGHLSFLEEARRHGDYLIVGLYSDQVSFFN